MVFPGEGERPKKKKPLHNFTFSKPSWGTHQTLRCVKVEYHGGSVDQRLRSEESEGIEEFREKIMEDIRTVKESIFREHVLEEEEEHTNEKETRPWNLRKRREACKDEVKESGKGEADQYNKCNRLGFNEEEVGVRPKFVSMLSKKEVEDDLMMMMGDHRPPRRPKKRPRVVQKKINLLHPAFYFSEVTEDIY